MAKKLKDAHLKKLTRGEQKQVLQWLAEDWGLSTIAQFVKEEFDKDITRQNVDYYKHVYETDIAKLRVNFRESMEEVPISNEIVRQQRRELIFHRYMKRGKLAEARQVLLEAEGATPSKSGVNIANIIHNNGNGNGNGKIKDEHRAIIQRERQRFSV